MSRPGSPRASAKPPRPLRPAGDGRLGTLAVRRFRLENGLTVLTCPDPAATAVAYMTWMGVGSRDESPDHTGLAHLFEHLMFTQTHGRPDGAFDRALETVGGNSNAMTMYDATAYIDQIPASAIPLVAGLEADRLLALDLRPKQIANEKDVVIEERLSSVEDNVDGQMDERLWGQAFTHHPYRFPVIGSEAHVRSVTPAIATAFYRRFYGPGNAVVVVAGAFDEGTALDAIARSYGDLPAAPSGPRPETTGELAPATVVRSRLRAPVAAERLMVGWPAPGVTSPDRPAYEILATALAGGTSSPIAAALVIEKGLALEVDAEVIPTRDPGLWILAVPLHRGKRAEDAEAIVAAQVAAAATADLPAALLDAAKARLEAETWRRVGSSEGKAEALGEMESLTGDFANFGKRVEALRAVTAADVHAVAAKYLGAGNRTVVIAEPEATGAPVPETP